MKPEAEQFIVYAQKLLADARLMIDTGLDDHAARTAYVERVTRHRSGMTMERFETRQNFMHLNFTLYERLEDRSALRASELVLDAIPGVSLARGHAAALDLSARYQSQTDKQKQQRERLRCF